MELWLNRCCSVVVDDEYENEDTLLYVLLGDMNHDAERIRVYAHEHKLCI